ncbi:hypothetical protein PABG_05439 [Paracoccidioides brasiliensis Pb03]|nr:hypothetical protein PABG_05439 [Paracoccidioides brasiliensis Pb03]
MSLAAARTRSRMGIQLVRYRGKYYSQLLQPNSDAISELLYTIPADSVEYILWLKRKRQQYAAKEKSLEDSVFTLDNDQTHSREYVTQKLREAELRNLPSTLAPKYPNHIPFFQIDLDLQLLSISPEIHFSLRDLPPDTSASSSTPSNPALLWSLLHNAANHSIPLSSLVLGESESDLDTYEPSFSTIPLSANRWLASNSRMHQGFYDLAFSNFQIAYSEQLNQDYFRWSPDDFIFRELAYAIISFASGRLSFRIEDLPSCCGRQYGSPWPSELNFGYHLAGHAPGSAPEGTLYWFDNVLVSLIPDIPERIHLYIDKAVNFGLEQGNLPFQAVLISLSTIVLLDVEIDNGIPVVKHTEPLKLFETCPKPHGSSPEPSPNSSLVDLRITSTYSPAIPPQPLPHEQVFSAKESFTALSNFCTTATLRHLKPHGPDTQGCLPSELYYMILDFTDNATFLTCARVSHLFRTYCLSKIRVCENQTKNDITPSSLGSLLDTYTHQIIQVRSPLCLTLQNRESGELSEWSPWDEKDILHGGSEPPKSLCLVPVFGESARLSQSSKAMSVFWKA